MWIYLHSIITMGLTYYTYWTSERSPTESAMQELTLQLWHVFFARRRGGKCHLCRLCMSPMSTSSIRALEKIGWLRVGRGIGME